MGQTWVVVAIVVVGIAVLALLFGRGKKPDAKPALKDAKAGAGAKAGAEGKGGEAKAGAKAGASGKAAAGSKAGGEAKAAAAAKPAPGDQAGPSRAKTVPEPAVQRKAAIPSAMLPDQLHEDEDDDITIVTLAPRFELSAESELPSTENEDDDDEDGDPDSARASAVPIIYDEDAAEDEPTRAHAVILVGAVGQTDRGQKRKINEDRYLALDEHNLYVVADGMGGHAGGEVASQLAVDTIAAAFKEGKFDGTPYDNVPRRGGELALAIQMANRAIYERAKREMKLQGMGTTIVSARFTPGKERVYIGHVGDSRCYRFRSGQLTQLTTDHTMGAVGMTGPFADHLSRAVGIGAAVKVDLIIAKPRHDDVFLLCSDGLSKMVKDDGIRDILAANPDPADAVKVLVERANEKGGRDNITVIVVVVKDPRGFARYMSAQERKRKVAESAAEEARQTPTQIGAPSAELLAAAGGGGDGGEGAAGSEASAGGAAANGKADPEVVMNEPQPLSGPIGAEAPEARPSAPVSDRKAAAAQSVPPPRPSVPPRPSIPEARKSAPEGRVSVTEARAPMPSLSDSRPTIPDAPRSMPSKSISDARSSSQQVKALTGEKAPGVSQEVKAIAVEPKQRVSTPPEVKAAAQPPAARPAESAPDGEPHSKRRKKK